MSELIASDNCTVIALHYIAGHELSSVMSTALNTDRLDWTEQNHTTKKKKLMNSFFFLI